MQIFKRTKIIVSLFIAILSLPFVSLADRAPPLAPIGGGVGFQYSCGPKLNPPSPFEKYGPRYRFNSDPTVVEKETIRQRGKIKVMQYNVENFFEKPGKYLELDGKEVFEYGSLEKNREAVEGVIRTINSESPDIFIGIEFESLHAAMRMKEFGLKDDYFMFLVPGNDSSNRNILMMVKKKLAADIEIQSHRYLEHSYLGKKTRLFSRDFPLVSFFNPGAPAGSDPVFMLGGVHLKSKRMEIRPGEISEDPGSVMKRTNQADTMLELVKNYDQFYGERVPIFVAGDFNAPLDSGKEFKTLFSSGFKNSFDVVGIPKNSPDRTTHTFFPGENQAPVNAQIDGFSAFGKSDKKITTSYVVKARSKYGLPIDRAQDYSESLKMESDHSAVVTVLDFSE